MSVPVYRLAQIFSAAGSHHKVGQGHEYERIGRVHSLETTAGLARGKVLNNMGRYYDVIVKRATKGKEVWQNTGFVAACSCPDPNALCKHIAATVFSLGRRLEADASVYEAWMGITADDGMGLPALSKEEIEAWWLAGSGEPSPAFDPDCAGRPDELLRRLGPPPRKLGLSDLPDLLAPAYSLIAKAGRQLIENPASAIKPTKARR
jgi:hypothetical protein